MSKKQFPLWAKITLLTTSVVLSTGLGIGTSIAYKYEGLLDTFFSSSDYVATEAEKECAKNIVQEGTVLLQNKDNALPLVNEKKIAVLDKIRLILFMVDLDLAQLILQLLLL